MNNNDISVTNNNALNLFKTILDDSNQMVQVSTLKDMKMLYANKAALQYSFTKGDNYKDLYCYQYMMGLGQQCSFCPLKDLGNSDCKEVEIDNGQQVFVVKTKIDELNGEKIFIEYARDITEIRRSEQIFKEQVERLLKSIPQAEGIIHFDLSDDICLSINGASDSIKTFFNNSTVNETIEKIISYVPNKKEKEDILKLFNKEALFRAYENGEIEINYTMETRFDDQSLRYAKAVARLLKNPSTSHLECVLYCMDISSQIQEKKETEESLREQLSIFNVLAKNYLNVYLLYPNKGIAKILKLRGYVTTGLDNNIDKFYQYNDVYKQYVKERVAPEYQEYMYQAISLETVINQLKDKETYSGTYLAQANGERHSYQFRYDRIDNGEKVIAAFQNIDELVSKEREQQKSLALALDAAQQSSQAKTQFLNNMSHDIRTPMNAIIGFTALAKQHGDNKEKLIDYLDKIETSGKHLLSLINDILDMSSIESGKVALQQDNVNLEEILNELHTISLADINRKNITYSCDTSALINKNVVCDRLRLKQILLNLLSNAIKFTPDNGNVTVTVKQVNNFSKDNSTYIIRVKDSGIGMSEQFQKHIFEAFTRENTSTISGIQGTGLGMAITKNLVDMMKGTITVNSKEGVGSEFTVSLPLQIIGDKQSTNSTNLENTISIVTKFIGKNILLVEDNPLNQEIAKEILESSGFNVDIAGDGMQAIDKVSHMNERVYDVILMDIQMPTMDGYTATKKIRQLENEVARNIPIIAVTANAFNEDKNKAIEAGMNGHVAKPLNIDELFKVLKEVLKK